MYLLVCRQVIDWCNTIVTMPVGVVGWTVFGTLSGLGALAFRRYSHIVTACTKAVGLCRGAALNHTDKKFRVAITGATSGVGRAVTEILGRFQPQVSLVLLVRDVQAGSEIARVLAERYGAPVPPAVIYCDLTSRASVENAVKELSDMWFSTDCVTECQGFDAVIHNAGVMLPRDKVIPTNLVAPVMMSELILRARAEANVQRALRMVYLSSRLHKRSLLATADDVVSVLDNAASITRYADSKRAILSYVANKSNSPGRDPSTKFVACTPGLCNTNLGAPFLPGLLYSALAPIRWLLLRDSTEGALGVLRALLDPRVENGDLVDASELLEHLPHTRPDLFVGEAVKKWAMP